MKQKTRRSRFDRLSDDEKEAIYQECEKIGPEEGRPLTASDRKLLRRAGLSVGRPRIGQGAKRINISMEKGLLKTADAFARKRGISRASLISESVKKYINGAA